MKKQFWIVCTAFLLTAISLLQAEEMSQSKRLKLVILDNSGTLNDCGVFAPVVAFVQVFEKYGIPITMDEARRPMGFFKKDHIRAILSTERVSQAFQDYHGRIWTEEDVEKMFVDYVPMQMSCLVQYAELIPGAEKTLS